MEGDSTSRMQSEVVRIHARVLGAVLAVVFGVGLFAATAWLVIKGGPNPGAHLRLLENYFFGFSVTWVGAFVGLFYGCLVGGILGWSIGAIYNRLARE